MKIFLIIWFGQLTSVLGSALSSFALAVWAYEQTGSVTKYALLAMFIGLPKLIFAPIAGVSADRFNRRWVMILGDTIAGISTLGILIFLSTGNLQLWHIYLANFLNSVGNTFQLPAYIAATSQLVPKRHLMRVGGMRKFGQAIANLVAPMLAGILLKLIKLEGILWIDILSFLVALTTLLTVRFPNIPINNNSVSLLSSVSIKNLVMDALGYLIKLPGLLLLFLFLLGIYLLMGMVTVLFTPLVLIIASPSVLGILLSLGGIGMILGGICLSAWKGMESQINLVLNFSLVCGVSLIAVGLQASIPVYGVSVFLFMFSIIIIETSGQVIFQKKVEPHFQGRVFSLTSAAHSGFVALAYPISGLLADLVFEPLMQIDGVLASTVGQLIGVGEGRGISLMFFISGCLTILATIFAYRLPRLRLLEKEVPDWSD